MPSALHEGLVSLFRHRPRLVPELLQGALGLALPPFADAAVREAAFAQLPTAEYSADLVVVLEDGGAARLGIIVEVQLAPRPEKQWTWPLYAAALRARLAAPACVLVVTPEPRVAAWARTPLLLGPPDSVFRPLVLGPDAVPVVTAAAQAGRAPELAVLSALAHRHRPEAVSIALAAVGASAGLDGERSRLYYDLVVSALAEGARRELEQLMANGTYEYQSEFARKYYTQGRAEGEAEGEAKGKAEGEAKGKAEGEAKGKAESLLAVLAARGLPVTDAQRARILACTDGTLLNRWIAQAVTAPSVEAALA